MHVVKNLGRDKALIDLLEGLGVVEDKRTRSHHLLGMWARSTVFTAGYGRPFRDRFAPSHTASWRVGRTGRSCTDR